PRLLEVGHNESVARRVAAALRRPLQTPNAERSPTPRRTVPAPGARAHDPGRDVRRGAARSAWSRSAPSSCESAHGFGRKNVARSPATYLPSRARAPPGVAEVTVPSVRSQQNSLPRPRSAPKPAFADSRTWSACVGARSRTKGRASFQRDRGTNSLRE